MNRQSDVERLTEMAVNLLTEALMATHTDVQIDIQVSATKRSTVACPSQR